MWRWLMSLMILGTTALSAEVNVLAFAGSTRSGSYNKQLVLEAANMAKQMGAHVSTIDLNNYPMPFYDGDLETNSGMPEKARQLRNQMIQNQVIIIATPEYNGSISAVLKNAIDWASRSEQGGPSRDAFKGKIFLLLSASQGPGGGKRSLAHLKSIIENVGGTVLSEEISLANAHQAFDSQGHLNDAAVKTAIQKALEPILSQKTELQLTH